MKKIFLLVMSLSVLLITGCYHVEISTEIHPKVTIIGNRVGISYELGDLHVMDQLDGLDSDVVRYLRTHKEAKFLLKVVGNENQNNSSNFTYHLDGVVIAENINTVTINMLVEHRNSIPNFICIEGCSVDNSTTSISTDKSKEQETKRPVENKITQPKPKEGMNNL